MRSTLPGIKIGIVSMTLALLASSAEAACDPSEFYPGVEDCEGPVVLVVAPASGEYCTGGPDECSGRLVVAAVVAGNGSTLCQGKREACNENLVFVAVMVGDNTSVCAAGQGGEFPGGSGNFGVPRNPEA